MIITPATTRENPPEQPEVQHKNGWSPLWRWPALVGVLLVSVFLNFYQLGQNGFANLYYAFAIRSMLDNWHNFFFVAFDPGGFVNVDKPPLGFWLQAASAKIFGFTPFSIFLPQALAGVLTMAVFFSVAGFFHQYYLSTLAPAICALFGIGVVVMWQDYRHSGWRGWLLPGASANRPGADSHHHE